MFAATDGKESDTFPTTRGEVPMVSSSNPDAVIDRVDTKVSPIANEIAGCARVEETGQAKTSSEG